MTTANQSPLKPLPRCVIAPASQGCVSRSAGRVLSVILEDGEAAEWFWTHKPQGSYVSGYGIVKVGMGITDGADESEE